MLASSAPNAGSDLEGRRAPAGLYFVRLETAGATVSRTIVLDR